MAKRLVVRHIDGTVEIFNDGADGMKIHVSTSGLAEVHGADGSMRQFHNTPFELEARPDETQEG